VARKVMKALRQSVSNNYASPQVSRVLSPEDLALLADAQLAFRPPPLYARAPASWRACSPLLDCRPPFSWTGPDRRGVAALKQPAGRKPALGGGSHGEPAVGGPDPGVLALLPACWDGARPEARGHGTNQRI
jgi:hypothetical protein